MRGARLRSAIWVVLPFLAGFSVGVGSDFWWIYALDAFTFVVALWGAWVNTNIAWSLGRVDAFGEIQSMDQRRRRWAEN